MTNPHITNTRSPHSSIARQALRLLPRLTNRDQHLLALLDEHAPLTACQLARLGDFQSLRRAQDRLLVLHRLGVLDRARPHTVRGLGSAPWLYALGPLGATLIAAVRGTHPPKSTVLRNRLLAAVVSPRLGHHLGLADTIADLATSTQGSLRAWWSEHRFAAATGGIARPDAYLTWQHHTGPVIGCYLEYDTGTESLRRLAAKLEDYRDLHDAGAPNLPVLFVLESTDREANLHERLTTLATPVTVATTARPYIQATGNDPAGSVWLAAGDDMRYRLDQLPAQPLPHPDWPSDRDTGTESAVAA